MSVELLLPLQSMKLLWMYYRENYARKNGYNTGKSMSEALIFASTNPQYDNKLFIELPVHGLNLSFVTLWVSCCKNKCF